MRKSLFVIVIPIFMLLIGCRNYVRDRPLSPGMTKEQVSELWGGNARKEFTLKEGTRIDFWYYHLGVSHRLYTVVFVGEKVVGVYSQYIGPQHVVVHHTGSIHQYQEEAL